jgi:hypothetical protein
MSNALDALEAAATAARRAANCQDPKVYRDALTGLGRAYLEAYPAKRTAPRIATAAEMRHAAAHDNSCVGAFARARPGAKP